MKLPLTLILTLLLAGFYSGTLTWAASVEVDPETIEILLRPGDSSPNFIKYTNLSKDSVEVSAEVRDLVAVGEDADVTTTNDPKYALTPFITIQSKKFTVPPGRSQSVEFVLTVPAGTKSGGYLGGIALTTPGQPELGSLILLNVSGYSYKSPELLTFASENLFTPGPANFTARVKNTNDNFLKVAGQIKIYDPLNRELAVLEIPPHNLLPGATRKINMSWDRAGLTGLYRAELTLNNDKTRDKLVSQSFIVGTAEPGVYLVLGLLAATVVLIYRKRRA